MPEIYSFTARVVRRLKNRIEITPDDLESFADYLDRSGLPGIANWHNGVCAICVSNRQLIAGVRGANRVRYTVERRATRMFGVKLEPL